MNLDNYTRMLLFCFVGITSINLMFQNNLDFVIPMNWTILIGISLFWIILEIICFKKELEKQNEYTDNHKL